MLKFVGSGGDVAEFAAQVVGTLNTDDGTFLWGWDHPSVRPGLDQAAAAVRAFGEERGIAELTTRKVRASEDQCWEFAAVACHLTDAVGAYRGRDGSTLVFFTFGEGAPTDRSDPREGLSDEFPTGAREAVLGFVAARYEWEVATAKLPDDEAFRTAGDSYRALLAEWCAPSVEAGGLSWASDPAWGPEHRTIVGGRMEGDQCRVVATTVSFGDMQSLFEFHLEEHDGRWLIRHQFLVDEEGRWESL